MCFVRVLFGVLCALSGGLFGLVVFNGVFDWQWLSSVLFTVWPSWSSGGCLASFGVLFGRYEHVDICSVDVRVALVRNLFGSGACSVNGCFVFPAVRSNVCSCSVNGVRVHPTGEDHAVGFSGQGISQSLEGPTAS